MPRKLDKYDEKRDFSQTSEPSGDAPPLEPENAPRFVIQEHSARSMHWDLRLERDGVAVSWAVPRGLPPLPKVNHFAKQTEDHPLKYLTWEGDIPKGNYGAGTMRIFDRGTYETEIWEDDKVQVIFHGERVTGRYGLVRTSAEEGNWLIHRMDPPQDPTRRPLPADVQPMLATARADVPEGDEWAYEVKWDGVRAIVFASGGRIDRISSRKGIDVTERYPEISRLGRQLGTHEAILDGEIVAFDERGAPSFSLLQERMGLTKERAIKRKMESVPVSLMIFDVLFLDGHDTTTLPYRDRRRLLELLGLDGEHWATPPYETGNAAARLADAHEQGFEGIVAKRLDSAYTPGKRGGAWQKVRLHRRQEFVIGGWIEGEGNRGGKLGSLAVGYYREPGTAPDAPLVFVGGVGTGYTEDTLAMLRERLEPLAVDDSPFDPDGPEVQSGGGRWGRREFARKVHWVRPQLVCEVEYTEITHDGILRHPSFKGLREDKDPGDVVLEPVAGAPAPAASPPEPAPEPDPPKRRGTRKSPAGEAKVYEFGERTVRLSNPSKPLYPDGFTKQQVVDYMLGIAPVLLPHLAERPLTMKRYPEGVTGQHFFEKNAPSHRPEWMRTTLVPRKEEKAGAGDMIEFALIDDPAGLAWVANLAAIELHTPMARAPRVDNPTMMVFDLDPGPPATIVQCCEVALHLREVIEAAGLHGYPKTSGKKGLQLYVPLNHPDVTYEHTRAFSNAVARLLEKQHPTLVVSKMTKALRTGKVLVDWSQNHLTKTTVCVYSLRENDEPTVSTPVTWDEVVECHDSGDAHLLRFRAEQVLERVAEHGDLFAPVLTEQHALPNL